MHPKLLTAAISQVLQTSTHILAKMKWWIIRDQTAHIRLMLNNIVKNTNI